jgi:hypothetical protein
MWDVEWEWLLASLMGRKGATMAKFSRPHYQLIAGALRDAITVFDDPSEQRDGVYTAASIIAEKLENDNPAFHRSHFMAVIRGEADVMSKPPRPPREIRGR